MDWKKVKALRKKVLADEKRLVDGAIGDDERRKRVGGRPGPRAKKEGGTQRGQNEEERRVANFFGWDPKKDRKSHTRTQS